MEAGKSRETDAGSAAKYSTPIEITVMAAPIAMPAKSANLLKGRIGWEVLSTLIQIPIREGALSSRVPV